MKAVVFHGVGDIRLEDVPEPEIQDPGDAIVRITASAICGTDLHMVRGTMPGMKPGTILGHEGVGIVEEVGKRANRAIEPGERVVICSTIACGTCSYCRGGYYAQCDVANPNGNRAGTAFFGGPESTGSFPGLQAELARVPYAAVGCVKIPENVTDDQAILLSDIFPTGWFAAELAAIHPGCTVAVFGCGPVGQFAILAARMMDAGRVIAVDNVPARLEAARAQGAEIVNFDEEDPIEVILELTGGIGVDRAIDAVGVDANRPHHGPAAKKAQARKDELDAEVKEIAGHSKPDGDNWHPGDGPSQAQRWAVEALSKAGTLAIAGVYPEADRRFPIGEAMNKNLVIRMGNCHHRKYVPKLLDMVRTGLIEPMAVLSHIQPMESAIEAYKHFDRRETEWMKVELAPALQ